MNMDCCSPISVSPLSEADAIEAARRFKALSDPARVRLLSLIAESGEICGCDLEGPLGLSQPTVSHHLKILAEADLIHKERRGKWVYAHLRPEGFNTLRDVLTTRTRKTLPTATVGS